jgi:filamentous hemagglutinin family protein
MVAVAIHLAFGAAAWGGTVLPQGASVVNGQVAISKPTENSLLINASGGAIVNWQQFSIGSNGQVRFTLPSASSAVLNRVVGADASQILGSLQSNGRVFLINPNGIVVGAGARIDANSFIGSTLDISDGDFLAGKLRFLAASGAGGIHNDGVITAGPGGRIALIAPDIQNTGIIHAPDGQILLAAGRKLEIASLDFQGITFEIQAPTDAVLNLGKLLAENGGVSAFAGTLRHSGEIRASRMTVDGDGSIILSGSNELTLSPGSLTTTDGLRGGSITLQSTGGTTHVSGTVSATGSSGQGGTIEILGNRVALDAGARVDASGAGGGGQVLVGGDFQGKNAAVQNASRVYVDADASIQADATKTGDGGKVVVWADENTRYYGDLSARGAASGGNGGSAEVSGKKNLEFAGSADLSAPAGQAGSLLLDPLDILVKTLGGILPSVVDQFADFSANIVTISPTAMNNVRGNVTLQAERDIYFNDTVTLTTPGAGISATAGGAAYDAGQIYINQPINTTAGAVTLRGTVVSGTGTINTNGGAVDIKTSGSESFSSAINSGGGTVSLQAQTGSVSSANVNAGSGAINVTAASGIYSGNYSTTGTVTLTTTAGSIGSDHITAGTATLSATGGSIYSEYVNAATAVNASSSNSSISLYNLASQPLRLGTLNAASSITLNSDSGFVQASGGLVTAPAVYLYNNNSSAATGTSASPLSIAAPALRLYDLATGAHIAFSGNPTLSELRLTGNLAGLSSTSVTGAANLSSFALSNSSGALNISADSGAVSGFASAFEVRVSDAAITVPSLNLLGGNVTLSSNAGLNIGTLGAASLSATAKSSVSLGTISTTGGGGIYVSTRACITSYVGCAAISGISATSLSAAGGGQVYLQTYDNGDITVSGALTAGSANLQAGGFYYTTANYPYFSMRTSNNIQVASATTTGSFNVANNGSGNVTIAGLSAGGSVYLTAGGSYTISDPAYSYYGRPLYTSNNMSVAVVEPTTPSGSFQISDAGIGNVSVTGAVTRPGGGITLSASNGSVTASGDLSANASISASAGGSNALSLANVTSSNGGVTLNAGTTLTVGQVSAGSLANNNNYSTSLSAGSDLSFLSVSSKALSNGYGNLSLTSSSGSIKTRQDNNASDVTASGNVTITANNATNGVIGDSAFANPMDIVSGTAVTNSVTLSAGVDIGAANKTVNVDTVGLLSVSSAGGKFFVAAQTPDAATQRSLNGIRLSASAAGLGSGGTSSLSTLDLSVSASSDGSLITIGDIVRSLGALNEFRFTTTGGGLNFGNVNLSTTGYNQIFLTSAGAMTQGNPGSNNIAGGYINLNSGSNALTVGNVTSSTAGANSVGNLVEISGGDITAGNLSGPGIKVSGANISLGSVTSSGTNRGLYGYYLNVPRLGISQYVTDELRISASGTLSTAGDISSSTSAIVMGAGITVAGGTGNVTGGHTDTYYYADKLDFQSGAGTLAAGTVNGYDVSLTGATINTGNVTANRTLNIGNGSTSTITTGSLNALGPIVYYGDPSISLNAASISTGNVSTSNYLSINSSGSYTPGPITLSASNSTYINAASVDLTSTSLTSSNITINATTGNITGPMSGATVSLTTASGNINTALTGTTNLTLNTGGQFAVTSTAALSRVDITADGVVAGAGSGSTVSDSTNQVVKVVDTTTDVPGALTLTFKPSGGSIAELYRESNDAITDITASTSGTLLSGSSIYISSPSAQVTTPVINIANGSLQVSTGGDVTLSALATGGGDVNVYSSSGNVNLTSVSSLGGSVVAHTSGDATKNVNLVSVNSRGGSVSLTADNGNIVGTGALAIDMRNANSGASGTLTLVAEQGSIGSAATPLLTSGEITLDARAKNDLMVDVANANPLTNLYITTTASGTGAISVTNSNYSGLTLTRSATTDLDLSGLNPTSAGAFSLNTYDGNINVKSDIGNVAGLSLIATAGDINIAAAGGVARTVNSTSGMTLQAGRDVNIAAGAAAAESVSVQSNANMIVTAGRDIKILAQGGSALLKQSATYNSLNLTAGRDVTITGGGLASNASASVLSVGGYETINATGNVLVQGGAATGAYATVQAGQSQTLYANNLSVLGGGDGAYASMQGSSQSFEHIYGDALVQGGTGSGAYAEVVSTSASQGFGNQSTYYYYNVTDSMRILGGAGSGAYASVRAAGTQEVHSVGDIQVKAGSGANANAEIKAGSSQNVGGTYNYYYNYTNTPTVNVLVQASSGGTARILANGNQSVQGGGAISVLGGDAAGMTASIETTNGSQTVGTSSNNYYVPTAGIVVQAGNGGAAWIKASGSQTLMTGGNLDVLGGGGASATASIESTRGSQTIGNTYIYYNDPINSITVKGGTGTGAAAWIKAATGQTIDAGGDISVTGGAAGAYAEIVSTAGSQTIGNQNSYYYDQTNTVALTGGTAANSYARIAALAGSQNVQATTGIHLTGGTGDASGALLLAATGQTIDTATDLLITGGNGTTTGGNESGLRNTTSGTQSVSATTGISIIGGGTGSDTWIRQSGSGGQVVSTSGNLALSSPTAGADITSVDAGAGGQTLTIGGTVTVNNAGSNLMQIASGADQSISTESLAIALSSTTGIAPTAGVTATGNQTLTLNGVDATTLATLSVVNLSAATESQALLEAGGNQIIAMNYLSAGKMTIGDVNAKGASLVKAGGDQTVVAGELLIQGGSNAVASSMLMAGTPTTGTLLVSTLSGPVSVLGGAAGPAAIDPLNLSVVSNGSILLTGGGATTASSNVTAGIINMTATNGNMLVVGGVAPATVVAATTATVPGANTFNLAASGGLTVTPGAGGASINALAGGAVVLGAPCFGCTTGLLGPFNLTAPAPPPAVTNTPNLLVADITVLLDQAADYFDLVLSEDGTLTSRRRSLAECY